MIRRVTDQISAIGPLGTPKVITVYAINDEEKAIIDSGPSSVSSELISGLREAGVPPENITRIILTHIHIDHAGGTWKLLEAMPNAKVLVPERGLKHLVDPTRLLESAGPILGELLTLWGAVKPVPQERVEPLHANETINLGRLSLKCIPAVGHAPHQMVFHDEAGEVVFAADALGIYHDRCRRFTPTSPPPTFDYPQAIRDIQMIRDLDPERVMLPHYTSLEASPALFAEMEKTYVRWHDLIEKDVDGDVQVASERILSEFPVYIDCIEPAVLRQVMRIDVGGMMEYFRRSALQQAKLRPN